MARGGGEEGGGEGGGDCAVARSHASRCDVQRFDQAAVEGAQGAAQVAFRAVDKRREDNSRALVLVPPTGEGGRSWLVLKL